MMDFIDLFAGIGGMRIPFSELGECVFTSEINRYSLKTYSANFSETEPVDIQKTHARDIPRHDLLLAGFPCQPFSIAGVSKRNSMNRPHGFDCTQGTLFHDIARIIRYHQPSAFLLENVRNLERHDNGNTFSVIIKTLMDEGYFVKWKVIDSSSWVPQKRERIFIIGMKQNFSFDIDIPRHKPKLNTILDTDVDSKYTLSEKLWRYLREYKEKHRKKGNGFGYSVFGPNDVARTLTARYHKDGSEILIEGDIPRRLTPNECRKLMGFPDWFKIPVSDTQAYQQFGNSVVVPVVRAIAESIFSDFSKKKQN